MTKSYYTNLSAKTEGSVAGWGEGGGMAAGDIAFAKKFFPTAYFIIPLNPPLEKGDFKRIPAQLTYLGKRERGNLE
jgi:hypothetical protein